MQKLCQRHPAACIAAALALLCGHVGSCDMQQFSIHVYGNESHAISPQLFGIFFEEVIIPLSESCSRLRSEKAILSNHWFHPTLPALQINNAGDGGLYAEMVQGS